MISTLSEKMTQSSGKSLDTLDPRFSVIVSYIEKSEYTEAVQEIEAIFNEGFFDIRLIMYYLYAQFLQEDFTHLQDQIALFTSLFTSHWEKLTPEKKKDKHTVTSVSWYFTRLGKTLQYHKDKQDDTWSKWLQSTTKTSNQAVLEEWNNFRLAFQDVLEAPAVLDRLQRITQWFLDFDLLLPDETKEKELIEINETEPIIQEISEKKSIEPCAGPTIPISDTFALFLKKLTAFETLIAENDLAKAALVGNDISESIASFDPRVYFPKTFSTYFRLLSQHIDTLSPYWDEKDSLAWQSLEQLYNVDIDTFMEV